jgi:iron complex transport system substrate-binding protein
MCGLISPLIPGLLKKAGDFLFETADEHAKANRCGSSLIMNKLVIFIIALICTGDTTFAAEKAALPVRIISLSPATTEVLFALGIGDRIVGVTSFCDHPEEAKRKQKVGGMSNPSLEAIMALKPDLVVMTTDGNPREVDDRLRAMGLTTYVWTERTLAELPGGVRKLAAVLGVGSRGGKLADEIEKTINASRSRIHRSKHAKVLYIVWPEPLLVAGPDTAIDDAIVLLGLENAAHKAVTSYPRYSIEELIREAPEVIFIGKGSGMDMRSVSQGILKKLAMVPAVKNNRICYVSDSLYRLGPRVVQGIEELAACVQ